jgi:hypothetical protein
MKRIYKTVLFLAIPVLMTGFAGCKKFLDTKSSTATSDGAVLKNVTQLNMVLNSAYKKLYFNNGGADRAYSGLAGLQMYVDLGGADILSHTNMGGNQVTSYTFEPTRTQITGNSDAIWSMMYKTINQVNVIITALPNADGGAEEKAQIMGQAKAIRAVCYFHLIQNYQQTYILAKNKPGVILRLSANDPVSMPRSSVEACYQQIVADLRDAKALLANFQRQNKWTIDKNVISGQLARVYLVMNDWPNALAEATTAYNAYSQLMTRGQYRSGFDKVITNAYPEIMWAMKYTETDNIGGSTQFNFWYNQDEKYGEGFTDGPIYAFLSFFADGKYEQLFEKTEDRYQFWKRTKNASQEWSTKWAYDKYKHYGDANGAVQGNTRPEVSLMRGSEMLLIMAEAAAHSGGDALTYLNRLQRARGVTAVTTAVGGPELLEAIYVERRKELLCEGVTGFYDLLRLQKPLLRYQETATYREGHYTWGVNQLNGYVASSAQPTGTLLSNDYRFISQIPQLEMTNNEALKASDQNPFSGQ